MGVLINQPEGTLPLVMSEVVRCNKRYILCAEYYSKEAVEVSYHNLSGALFERDYRKINQSLFTELRYLKESFLSKKDGCNDLTF
jgi:hypothetical protein